MQKVRATRGLSSTPLPLLMLLLLQQQLLTCQEAVVLTAAAAAVRAAAAAAVRRRRRRTRTRTRRRRWRVTHYPQAAVAGGMMRMTERDQDQLLQQALPAPATAAAVMVTHQAPLAVRVAAAAAMMGMPLTVTTNTTGVLLLAGLLQLLPSPTPNILPINSSRAGGSSGSPRGPTWQLPQFLLLSLLLLMVNVMDRMLHTCLPCGGP